MKLFITGATGFVGSQLVRQALAAGHEVLALRRPGSCSRIALAPEPRWLDGNLESFAPPGDCDMMIHAAAHSANTPYDNLDACIHWNVSAALHAVSRAHAAGIRRFVFVGSCFEYGHSGDAFAAIPADAPLCPVGSYPVSKAMASLALLEFARERQLVASLARLFHIYGEGEPASRFWPALKRAAESGADFPMSDGTQVRDFVPVETAAALLLAEAERLATLTAPEQTLINLGTGHGQRLVDFAAAEWRRLGATGTLRPGTYPRKPGETERLVPELTRRNWLAGTTPN
ncbi:MAG: NAD-dependent epimerase/dehydratase family protein [Zoogloea sp.]|nr:NAD-dependent epimerase/dehydratase family protein [Zoogloea sp.]